MPRCDHDAAGADQDEEQQAGEVHYPARPREGVLLMRKAKTTVLPSENRNWGFYGTVHDARRPRSEAAADREWQKMSRRCRKAGLSAKSCRDFLDSRVGRHLADQVLERKVTTTELKKSFIDWWKNEVRG